jgi:mono/diheme cytochrome c family protein
MKKILFAPIVLAAVLDWGSGYGQMGMMQGNGGASFVRHQYVMGHGLDPDYASMTNPLRPGDETISAGKKLYEQNCAACHGETGEGDGVAGKQLNPPPANVAVSSKMPMATDGYLYWTIAEGGVPVHTAMPPFKDALKKEQIWQIITYLREL